MNLLISFGGLLILVNVLQVAGFVQGVKSKHLEGKRKDKLKHL